MNINADVVRSSIGVAPSMFHVFSSLVARRISIATVCAVALLSTCAHVFAAPLTNIWPFTTPSQYVVSNTNDIEVAEGVARLKLFDTSYYQDQIFDYLGTNGALRSDISVGPGTVMSLVTNGALFFAPAVVNSRVIDGGAGNVWEKIYTRSGIRAFDNSSSELNPSESGLLALYHLNTSDWIDRVSGSAGTPSGANFASWQSQPHTAKFGNNSLRTEPYARLRTVNATLLNGRTQFSMSAWVYFRKLTPASGVLFSRGNYIDNYWQMIGFVAASSDNSVLFRITGRSGEYASFIPVIGEWMFLVGTYDGVNGNLRIYVNGKIADNKTFTPRVVDQTDYLYLGWDDYEDVRGHSGMLDEVAIWSRVLSPEEIQRLYAMPNAIKFQVRSGNTSSLSGLFVGPDGTTNSFYQLENVPLVAGGGFSPFDRFLQYRLTLESNAGRTMSPLLDTVAFYGTKGVQIDSTLGDYLAAMSVTNSKVTPDESDVSCVALRENRNGGHASAGIYSSRVFDNNGAVWNSIAWPGMGQVTYQEPNLLGLWNMENSWADDKTLHDGFATNAAFTSIAKVGAYSGVLNGSANVALGAIGTAVRAIEFWVNDANFNDSLIDLDGSNVCVLVTNGVINVPGVSPAAVTIYVNGKSTSQRLLPGWNHVVINFDVTVNASAVNIGYAQGDYMEGLMDGLAIYNATLGSSSIKIHYVLGRQWVAGTIKMQVRSGTTLPLTGAFRGPGGPTTYFTAANGSSLLGAIPSGNRYMQYRAFLSGDGNATPALDEVTITYGGNQTFVDDTRVEFDQGSYDSGTVWLGDEIKIPDLAEALPGSIDGADSSVLALWHMDESGWSGIPNEVVDSSVWGNHGRGTGNANTSPDAIVGTRVGVFDGVGDYIITRLLTIGSDDFSMSAWFKTSYTNRAAIFSCYDSAVDARYYTLEINGNGNGIDTGRVAMVISHGIAGQKKIVVSSRAALNDGHWHQIVGMRQGNYIFIYVDGERQGMTAIGAYGSVHNPSAPPFIGRYGSDTTKDFSGLIDEVAVFTRALNDGEINDSYAGGYQTRFTGKFVSDYVDASRGAMWGMISWNTDAAYGNPLIGITNSIELADTEVGLLGLWHLNTDWSDSMASHPAVPAGGAAIVGSGVQKTGAGCALFAPNASAVIGNCGIIKTIEFWVDDANANDGLITLNSSGGGISIVAGAIVISGSTDASIFINSRPGTRLARGWNHVAITTATGFDLNDFRLGVANGLYMSGRLDEVAIYTIELGEGEIRQHYLSQLGPASLAGLWHLDESTGNVLDAGMLGNHGTVNGATYGESGKFGTALGFRGSGDYVQIPDSGNLLDPSFFTFEGWFFPDAAENQIIGDKRGGGAGFALGTDASGRAFISVNGTVCADTAALRAGYWHHLAGSYDGTKIALYVDGELRATVVLEGSLDDSAAALWLGRAHAGAAELNGLLDEVVLSARALGIEEILDHYRAGSCFLGFQGRSNGSIPMPDESTLPFMGPDGTTNSYFTTASGSGMLSVIPSARYFQYKAFFRSENYRFTPRMQGVRVDVSSYPTDGPYVLPANGYGASFLGDLINFSETPATNHAGDIVYQISGNNGTNWYYWDGSTWADATGSGYNLANAWNEISIHISTFYDQLYAAIGGNFKFKAFLMSLGNNMASLDEVRLGFTAGRLVVLQPNGLEVGEKAWLRGFPYRINWSSSGNVTTNKLVLEYSLNSLSGPWVLISSNVLNTGSYAPWTTPQVNSDHVRVRIRDAVDPTIMDESDGDFSLTFRFNLVIPNGGEKWYIGHTNVIRWESAAGLGGLGRIDFSGDNSGSNFFYNITNGVPNISGGSNSTSWIVPRDEALLSETAKLRVQTLAGGGADLSDDFFTMAGVKIVNPTVGSAFKSQAPANIKWVSAGAGPTVTIQFSQDSGTTWTNVDTAAANVLGTNTYVWNLTVLPTETARIRIFSNTDPNNITDLSPVFTVANIEVQQPAGGVDWQSGRTNTIVWAAGGAGDKVNIYYSTNAGTTWILVTDPAINNISGLNTFQWIVPPYPTAVGKIKVESVIDPINLFGVSSNFNIAGVRIVTPGGGEKWEKGFQNFINWSFQSAGDKGTLEFSYDGGITWINVVGPGLGLVDLFYPFTPVIPTVRGMAKIIADDPFPFTDMVDQSDSYMTVAGIKVNNPTNTSVYTLGMTNKIEWTSAGSEDPAGQAMLYYSSLGTDTNLIQIVGNNQSFPGDNTFNWRLDATVEPSESARVVVKSGAYTGYSDYFVLRGVKVTQPVAGQIVDIGSAANIVWKHAGLSLDASADFYLSTDGGTNFGALPINPLPYPLSGGAYPWTVSADTLPSTNAVIKLVVVASSITNDIGVSGYSVPFYVRGLKVAQPMATNVWALNTTNQITWFAALAGTYADLYYSADGITFDTVRPIAKDALMSGVFNTFTWGIERFRLPSTNARVRVQAGTRNGTSAPFRMEGIKVLTPLGTDIWALDETNRISWKGVGTSGSYTIQYIKFHSQTNTIISGLNASFYDWAIPAAAVGTDVVIRVFDDGGGSYRGDSDQFRVVGEPEIVVINPAAGDQWKVSQTYSIAWVKGGRMQNNFRLQYSTEPYMVTNDIYTGPVDYDSTNNTYLYTWNVPDRIGRTRISILNNVNPLVLDDSDEFRVVGMFTVLAPNGGETNMFARRPTTVSWYTRGSVGSVDLFYSVDPLHAPGSWVYIATVPNNGFGASDVLTTYDWTVADVESTTARFRVQQAGVAGASDDSDADFSIRYYTIVWHVFDAVTSTNLDNLSISDSSGWSASRLTSPVTNKYPFGFFDTVWSREYFFDGVVFNWKSEPSRTIDVPLSRSSIDPDYRVMADFLYDSTTNEFRIHAWLERGGKMYKDPQSCHIQVYDKSGVRVADLPSTTPDDNGVFWLVWNVSESLPRGEIYFAKVDIVFSDATFSSGLTFNLRIPTEAEQGLRLLALASNIYNSVTNASTNLDTLAEAQGVFRDDVRAALGNLSNMTANISTGVSGIATVLTDFQTQSLARLDTLTNTVGVIGVGEPTLLDRVAGPSNIAMRTSQILTRPTSVKLGSTVTIFYRTRSAISPSPAIRVLDSLNIEILAPHTMVEEGGTGIYGYDVPFVSPAFAPGEYTVTCSDSIGSDKLIIRVTSMDLDDLSGMTGISNQLTSIDTRMTAMISMVSNINGTIDTLGALTNLSSAVQILTNINWGALSNISSIAVDIQAIRLGVTNLSSSMSVDLQAIRSSVSNLSSSMSVDLVTIRSGVSNIYDSVSNLGTLTNLASAVQVLTNIDWGTLTNISSMVSDLDSIRSGISNIDDTISTLGSLTNLSDAVHVLTNINWSTLSNISTMAIDLQTIRTGVTNIDNTMKSLTNISLDVALPGLSNILTVVTNIDNAMRSLTNLSIDVSLPTNIDWSVLSNISAVASEVHTVRIGVSNLEVAVGSIDFSPLTNINDLAQAISNIDLSRLTNFSAVLSGIDSINTNVSTIMGRTAGMNWSEISTILSTVSNIQHTVGGFDFSPLTNINDLAQAISNIDLSRLTNFSAVLSGIEDIGTNVSTIMGRTTGMNWADITAMRTSVSNMDEKISGFDLSPLTNIAGLAAAVSNIDLSAVTNLSALVGDLTIIRGQTAKINWTNIQEMMLGINQLKEAVTNLQIAVTNIGGGGGGGSNGLLGITRLANVALSNLNLTAVVMSNLNLSMTTNLFTSLNNLNISAASISNLNMTLTTNYATTVSNLYLSASELKNLNLASLTNMASVISNLNMSAFTNIATTFSNLQMRTTTNIAVLISNITMTAMSEVATYIQSLSNGMETIAASLDTIGPDANAAAKKARSASTAAATAQTAIQQVQTDVKAGKFETMLENLLLIRKSLESAKATLSQVPGEVGTSGMSEELRDVIKKINELAAKKGFPTIMEEPSAPGTGGGPVDPQAVTKLNASLTEAKAMMEAVRQLMDESVNKPIVKDWLGPAGE